MPTYADSFINYIQISLIVKAHKKRAGLRFFYGRGALSIDLIKIRYGSGAYFLLGTEDYFFAEAGPARFDSANKFILFQYFVCALQPMVKFFWVACSEHKSLPKLASGEYSNSLIAKIIYLNDMFKVYQDNRLMRS